LRSATEGFACFAVEFSPFEENKFACAAGQNFGIVGNGRQYVFVNDGRGLRIQSAFDTQDGLFDCAWSEENERILLSASGDGSLKIWDTAQPSGRPIQSIPAHEKEVYSVHWNPMAKDTFVSGSWDLTAKLWSPRRPAPIMVFAEHTGGIYDTVWSPSNPRVFASVAGDGALKIWDTNERHSVQTVLAHHNEVLSCDWNKYEENVVVTGSVDKTIKIWDLRNPRQELTTLSGHSLAVRRVKCSPHFGGVIASCSYDMSVIIWDTAAPREPLVRRIDHHTEFVQGIDFNLFIEGQIATCSWDQTVDIINV